MHIEGWKMQEWDKIFTNLAPICFEDITKLFGTVSLKAAGIWKQLIYHRIFEIEKFMI